MTKILDFQRRYCEKEREAVLEAACALADAMIELSTADRDAEKAWHAIINFNRLVLVREVKALHAAEAATKITGSPGPCEPVGEREAQTRLALTAIDNLQARMDELVSPE